MTPIRSSVRGARAPIVAATLAAIGSLAIFQPGYPLYDSVAQYRQVLSGEYDDWHPPAMAWMWTGLHRTGGGAMPMLTLQMLLYWLGFALVAGALTATGRRAAGWAVLAISLWPPFLGWQAAVLKDAQMAGAMLAAVGLIGWWRLRGQRVPAGAWGAIAVLLGYAVLVRANAVFAVVPLVVMLAPGWRPFVRVGTASVAIVVVLVIAGSINHDLLRAHRSGVERTEAIYDLAGIAVRAPDAAGLPLDRPAIAALITRRCVKPFFWDPLGEPDRCNGIVEPLRHIAPGALYLTLARAIIAHPLAYGVHRLAHLNSTTRWLVSEGLPSASPPTVGEPNDVGLAVPGDAAAAFQRLAGVLAHTPVTWPITWIVVAATGWAVAVRRVAAPARDLALALATSALTLEASFTVLSIASDLRYHLWAMIAAALALLLLGGAVGPRERQQWAVGAGTLALVVAGGVVARLMLPVAPATYVGMLAW